MTKDAKQQRAELFSNLIKLKFGNVHGFKAKAATALGCASSNFSSMLLGRTSIPQKYIDALKKLPDHTTEENDEAYTNRDMYQSRIAGGGTWYASLSLSQQDKERADAIATSLNNGEPIELDFSNFSILVAHLINQCALPDAIDPLS